MTNITSEVGTTIPPANRIMVLAPIVDNAIESKKKMEELLAIVANFSSSNNTVVQFDNIITIKYQTFHILFTGEKVFELIPIFTNSGFMASECQYSDIVRNSTRTDRIPLIRRVPELGEQQIHQILLDKYQKSIFSDKSKTIIPKK